MRRILGYALRTACLLSAIVLYLLFVLPEAGLLLRTLAIPFLIILGLLFHLSDRLTKITAQAAMRKDSRKPVLFLRPFQLDQVRAPRRGLWLQLLLTLPFPWEFARVFPRMTIEEMIVSVFQGVGPVVALGHPDNPVEPVGSARLYAGDDWQDQVTSLSSRAGLHVVIPESRPSVVWELNSLCTRLDSVIVIPRPDLPREERDLEWKQLRKDVPYLPEIEESTALVWFQDGEPLLVRADSGNLKHRLHAIRNHVVRVRHGVSFGGWVAAIRFFCLAVWIAVIPAIAAVYALLKLQTYLTPIAILLVLCTLTYYTKHVLPFAKRLGIGAFVHPIRDFDPLRWARPRLTFFVLPMVLVLAILGVRHYLIDRMVVPSGSMLPGFEIGEVIWIDKRNKSSAYGSVIVFEHPGGTYFKRICAVSGDTIRMESSTVYVNGIPLSDDGIMETSVDGEVRYEVRYEHDDLRFPSPLSGRDLDLHPGLTCGEDSCTVEDGYVFVLGDNRTNCLDSRHYGGIQTDYILGTVL